MTFPMTAWGANERDIVTLSAPVELTRLVDGGITDEGFRLVTKSTRAKTGGRDGDGPRGAIIYCPNCEAPKLVFHFAWPTLYCDGCDTPVDKEEWWINSGDSTTKAPE